MKDEKGNIMVDEDGEPMKAPISPQNNAKLAIVSINKRRLEKRREATKLYNSGAISKDEYDIIMAKNKRLTNAQKASIEEEAQEQDWVAFKASYQNRMGLL